MKVALIDIESKIVFRSEGNMKYLIVLRFGALKFKIELSESDLLELIKNIIQEKTIALETEMECCPLTQDKKNKYLEITNKTFNPRMVERK